MQSRSEAANGTQFASLYTFMPDIAVPAMYAGLTTPKVRAH